MKKNTKTKIGYGTLGYAMGEAARTFVHEPGHWAMTELVNLDPKVNLYAEIDFGRHGLIGGNTGIGGYMERGVNYDLVDSIIAAGGCTFNYLAGLGTGFIARKIDKNTHPKTKALLTGFSIFNSVYPAYYSTVDYLNLAGNDFEWLDNVGIPFKITIPLTLGISAALVYYNIRGYKDTVEKKVKRIEYNGINWREKRKKWKEEKEKIIGDFEKYFDDTKNPRRKAKKAWKRLNNIEVIGNDYKDRNVEKFAREIGVDSEEARELVDEYIWNHDSFTKK